LYKTAAEIETLLKDGIASIWENKIKRLGDELAVVLDELHPLLDDPKTQAPAKPLSDEQVLALFEKLEPLLEKLNPECVALADDIRAIALPEAETLAQQIENYDFENASKTLQELKKKEITLKQD
jgi:hypothetical protein